MTWYNKYVNIPYKHLGNNIVEGIDCFNLCRHVIEQEKGFRIPFMTSDCCNIADVDWYKKTSEQLIEKVAKNNTYWKKITHPKPFDIVLMSLGATNITNHCALYVDTNKLLQTMEERPSYITLYGNYYKQYTTGIYRWKELIS